MKSFIYKNIVYPIFKDQIDRPAEFLYNELQKVNDEKYSLIEARKRDSLVEKVKIELGFDPTKSRENMIKAGLLTEDNSGTGKVIKLEGDFVKEYLGEDCIDGSRLRVHNESYSNLTTKIYKPAYPHSIEESQKIWNDIVKENETKGGSC